MTPLRVITTPELVDEYLRDNDLTEGNVPIEVLLVQHSGTSGDKPAVMIVVNVDGELVVAKTSLRLLEGAMTTIEGALQSERLTSDDAIRARSEAAFEAGKTGEKGSDE